MWKRFVLLAFVMLLAITTTSYGAVANFDDLVLAPNSHYGGAGSRADSWTNGDVFFPHSDEGFSWSGFTYSNVNDTTTAGFTNQFAAYTGADVSGSGNYAVSYIPLDFAGGTYDPIPQVVSFGAVTGEDFNTTISGAYFTNTTYAYLSMRDGDAVGKRFGGDTGNDPDYFRMLINGYDVYGDYSGTVVFYLADFRSPDNSLDYILDEWTWVDLTSLGNVVALEFLLESSDVGNFGMNTPGYFAMDNLNGAPVPIPGAAWLLGSGLLGLIGWRRRRR